MLDESATGFGRVSENTAKSPYARPGLFWLLSVCFNKPCSKTCAHRAFCFQTRKITLRARFWHENRGIPRKSREWTKAFEARGAVTWCFLAGSISRPSPTSRFGAVSVGRLGFRARISPSRCTPRGGSSLASATLLPRKKMRSYKRNLHEANRPIPVSSSHQGKRLFDYSTRAGEARRKRPVSPSH